jgi:hypothetical protein
MFAKFISLGVDLFQNAIVTEKGTLRFAASKSDVSY